MTQIERKICPYPGLRPFTEDESIFFKGREVHIRQIIRQLEEKKFVIITGASGDGKSSLVYAGVIPQARAGFFRAKYNNWLISDFRPERSPLHNLAQTISFQLELDFNYVKEELSYGFNSLVTLYKSSKFYIDYESDEWKKANEKTKKDLKLNAGNLFILADQFEEFFTNTENFNNNKPSSEAYTTINLLLETAQIAYQEDLPIFIVFTMRSDYISQSVSFKGLPEYIGFSQFFVPRLKRNELKQIIEEPAILSAGKVTKSLSEKLINDLPDGFDQLPVLQHVMNKLWKCADNGNEEIGLIHLAKIAGMDSKRLKDSDREIFNDWFENIDGFQKKYYKNPGITNVLNTHANVLYETSFDYFLNNVDWAKNNIDKEDSYLILKTSFQSLTKIDEGRAVRNRMTLKEITKIINKPEISSETVCGVLNIYRLQDSTFIRPFINPNNIESQYLSIDTVFDITHEALIRNWQLLITWEEEESEKLSNLKDFEVQLERWLNSNKSDNFLLSLGALSHFEEWYEKSNPNEYWIAKYDKSSLTKDTKLSKAQTLAENIKEFLEISRAKITHTQKSKLRRRNVLLIASVIIILVLSGFTYWAVKQKSYAQTQTQLAESQRKSAEKQKKRAEDQTVIAVNATKLAEKEKERAEKNEKEALNAKKQSDLDKAHALKMHELAEDRSKLAKKETERAKKEKEEAQKQKKIAETERTKAELASDSAKTLTNLATAQSLALKSHQKYDDKQLNLLLAYQAYLLNNENGGKRDDPAIYEALRNALENYGVSNTLNIEKKVYSSFNLIDNSIITLDENGNANLFDFSNQKALSSHKLKLGVPINSSFYIDNKLFLSLEDNSLLVWENFEKQYTLNNIKSLVRSVVKDKNNRIIINERNKNVTIWDFNKTILKPEEKISIESRANGMVYLKNINSVILGLNNGKLINLNLLTKKIDIVSQSSGRISCVNISPNNKLIIVGYSNGILRLYSTTDLKLKYEKHVGNAGIKNIIFNKKSNKCIIASNDKTIKVFYVNSFEKSPIILNNHLQNIKQLGITKEEKLFALCDDNTLRMWELNSDIYAKSVFSLINRNFTSKEWNTFVGKNIDYTKIK